MFGEFDHGSALGEGSDLVDATRYAVMVEGVYGMGGSLIAEHHDDPSKALDIPEVRKAVQKLLFQELGRAIQLLTEHRRFSNLCHASLLRYIIWRAGRSGRLYAEQWKCLNWLDIKCLHAHDSRLRFRFSAIDIVI